MRFVALSLTILLVAACQTMARHSDYEQIRSGVVTYLGQLKDTAQKAITRLDDAEYKDLKERLNLSLERIQGFLETASAALAPVRETIGPQVVAAIGNIEKDIEELQKELEPKREELRQVVKKHLEEYRQKLEPLLKEYAEKHREQMESLRVKVEPVLKDLQDRIKVNLEETKSKLTPIVEILRNKAVERVDELKQFLAPYVQEYKDQAQTAFGDLKAKYESGELQKKLATVSEEIKPQLEKIFETLQKAFVKA
ncbi:apolipoprotein A-Ib [Salminus brasiliensis]|uniref:apolipoprotein A-Ib n=1 Tax=Salminus brasiliensis TaxID=930266 RepID=UPI003B838B3E